MIMIFIEWMNIWIENKLNKRIIDDEWVMFVIIVSIIGIKSRSGIKNIFRLGLWWNDHDHTFYDFFIENLFK